MLLGSEDGSLVGSTGVDAVLGDGIDERALR